MEEIDGDGKTWNVELLDLKSPLGEIRAEGSVPPTPAGGAWVDASLDLAALARQLPQTLHLRDALRVERGATPTRQPEERTSTPMRKAIPRSATPSGKVTDLVAHRGGR